MNDWIRCGNFYVMPDAGQGDMNWEAHFSFFVLHFSLIDFHYKSLHLTVDSLRIKLIGSE